MMHNSNRNGAQRDVSAEGKTPHVREADRAGKAGDAVKDRNFTVPQKPSVIEIRDGKVAVKSAR